MLCKKCNGVPIVIKVHETNNISKPRKCDVKCLDCGHVMKNQPYD